MVTKDDWQDRDGLSREEAWGAARRAIASAPLFAGLPGELLDRLVARARPLSLAGGAWLMRQGDAGDAAFAVCSGRLQLVVEDPEPARVIGERGYGDTLGELSLLTGLPRTASVRALRDSDLLVIGREEFMALLGDPGFASALLGRLAELVTQPPAAPPPDATRPRVLALIRAGGALPWDQLVSATWRAASALGPTTMLTGPEEGAGDLEGYGQVLDRLETQSELVLLVCRDPEGQPGWRAFCARQADRVVAVAPCAGCPSPPAAIPDGCDLVLVREHPGEPVAGWLGDVRPRAHHVLDAGDRLTDGVRRTVRRILGRSVGVVLSGGGARALVHLGVLEALHEGGLVVDRFGGTSMGAFVSALAAEGVTPAEAIAVCRREWAQGKPLGDYVVPRRSLIRGDRARAMLDRVFGERRIEDLALDWFAVSADLLAAEPVVHRRGRVAEAVGASMRLPGLVPPLPSDGRLLVDGGVLNNLPIDVMAERGEGPVIAVDAMARREENGSLRNAPSITEVLARSAMLGSLRAAGAHRARAHLLIAPQVPAAGLLEFGRIDEMVEAGRRAGEDALARALALA